MYRNRNQTPLLEWKECLPHRLEPLNVLVDHRQTEFRLDRMSRRPPRHWHHAEWLPARSLTLPQAQDGTPNIAELYRKPAAELLARQNA